MQRCASAIDPDRALHHALDGAVAENADTLAEQRAFGQVMAIALVAINLFYVGLLGYAYVFAWTR